MAPGIVLSAMRAPDLEPLPRHSLAPDEVLALVLASFGGLESGAERLYSFASDSLRTKVGSLDDLKRTLANELFAPLIGGQQREVVELDLRGDVARAWVVSGAAHFIVGLARREHGRQAGCWLVTALARDQADG